MAETFTHLQNIRDCKKICKDIQEKYDVDFSQTSIKVSPIKRVYCLVCKKLGYSLPETTKGMGLLNHTTILHHLKKANDVEKEMAEDFILYLKLKEEHTPKKIEQPEQPKNIYEITGFRYDDGKKECSTNWKRVYPLKPLYRGI